MFCSRRRHRRRRSLFTPLTAPRTPLLLAVVFFCFYGEPNYSLGAPLDWTIVEFAVVLPLVGFVWIAYGRRERCLDLLSEAKSVMLSLVRAHTEWPGSGEGELERVHASLAAILGAMHAYFLPARFYSRTYPYLGYKTAMVSSA